MATRGWLGRPYAKVPDGVRQKQSWDLGFHERHIASHASLYAVKCISFARILMKVSPNNVGFFTISPLHPQGSGWTNLETKVRKSGVGILVMCFHLQALIFADF